MNNALLKISAFCLASMLLTAPAYALKDSANLALDKVESVLEDLGLIEEIRSEVEKTAESIKAGLMGPFDALKDTAGVLKSYANSIKNLDVKGLQATIQAQAELGANLQNAEKTGEAVTNVMVPVYGQGNDSEIAYQQKRKRLELLHNNISTLYAHALATRANLVKNRNKKPEEVSLENARELVNANRLVATQIVRRYNDILFMEAQIVEFEATSLMTSISTQSSPEGENTDEDKEGEGK